MSPIIDLMESVKFNNFYVRSGLFGILSLAGAVFNYALYPILVRILNSEEFGDFAVIMAISNQLLGILLAFNIISIYLVKSQPEEKARNHAQIIQKALIWVLMTAIVCLLIASPYLNNLLQVQNASYFFILALLLLTAIPGVIWTGYLQGHKELIRVGGFNLSAALLKLILATLLAIGLGTTGGLLGVLGGSVVGLIVLWFTPGVKLPSLRSLFSKSDPTEKQFLLSLKRYIVACLLVVGSLSFLQNYDITLAKILFEPSTAGFYSGVSILSNALYFLCFLLVWIILPEIKIGDHTGNRRVLKTAYKLLGLLTLGVLAVEFIFKDLLTQTLLGRSFSEGGNLLIFASLYQLTLVAITLYAYYLLINRDRRAVLLAVTVFGGSVAIPALYANTPQEMISLLWISLTAGFGVYYLLTRLISVQAGRARRT